MLTITPLSRLLQPAQTSKMLLHLHVWEQNGSGELHKPLSGWPSGLRRQTQGCDPFTITVAESFLVHICGRGFESHFWHIFFFLLFSFFVCILKDNATAGNRTPINCLEGNYANHYTTVAVSSYLSDVLCIFFSKNTLLSHLHTADISFTYSNLPLVGIIKLSESDLGEQKEYETHWCLSRGKKKKRNRWDDHFFLSLIFLFLAIGQIKCKKSSSVSLKFLFITHKSFAFY